MLKIGDRVAYIILPDQTYYGNRVDTGMVIYIDDNIVKVARNNVYTLQCDSDNFVWYKITNTNKDDIKLNMREIVNYNISILKSKIRQLTAEEKEELKVARFNEIKEQITKTIKNMLDSDDEDMFINRLKQICQLKEGLFAIKVSNLYNINKYNGEIKYQIKEVEKLFKMIDELVLE